MNKKDRKQKLTAEGLANHRRVKRQTKQIRDYLEDQADIKAAEKALKEPGKSIFWEDVVASFKEMVDKQVNSTVSR